MIRRKIREKVPYLNLSLKDEQELTELGKGTEDVDENRNIM